MKQSLTNIFGTLDPHPESEHNFVPTSARDWKVHRDFKKWPIFRSGLCDMKDIHSCSIFSERTEKQVVLVPWHRNLSTQENILHCKKPVRAQSRAKSNSTGSSSLRENTTGPPQRMFSPRSRSPQQTCAKNSPQNDSAVQALEEESICKCLTYKWENIKKKETSGAYIPPYLA